MNFAALIRFTLILLFLAPGIFAQYVQKNSFAVERDRRTVYGINDWLSYTTASRFSSAAVGPEYLYIGTRDGGILRYHIFENYWDFPFTTSSGLPSNHIVDLIYDQTTSFLFAIMRNDVAVFDPASEEWISRSENPVWNYELPGSRDNLPNDGVPREIFRGRDDLDELPTFFANRGFQLTGDWLLVDDNFDEYPVVGYIRDRFDRIWFLVDGFGIGMGDLFSSRADFYRLGLPDIEPRALEYQYDDLWIGGIGDRSRESRPGIARWPYEGVAWDYYQERFISRLPKDDVNSILADGDSVWFATSYGVTLFDTRSNKWRNYNQNNGLVDDEVLDLAILQDYLYAGTERGISRISLQTGRLEKIKDRRINGVTFRRMAIQDDILWCATDRGIFRYVLSKNEWQFVPAGASIQDLNLTAVTTYQNEVWFAGAGGVMWYDSDEDRWQSYPQLIFETLPPYSDIAVNKESVWVASASGLLKYDREFKYWRLFTTEDGLLDNYCNQLLLDGDYIWIVTNAGLTQYYWNDPMRSY